jgi:periplasmic divalent cation tolerance protein
MGELILLYVPCPSKEAAGEITARLMEKRLIACANIFPVQSIYRWEGSTLNETEYVMLAKTVSKKSAAAEKEIKRIHPYKIPAIIRIAGEANKDFLQWAAREVC